MAETYADVIDIAGLKKKWPPGRDVPQLVLDVLEAVREAPWGAFGTFRVTGDRMDDYWIENGADLWAEFGTIFNLADGSRIALWFHDGATPDAQPVVNIDSEGQCVACAPDLKTFLHAWITPGPDFVPGDLIAEPEDFPADGPNQQPFAAKATIVINAAADLPQATGTALDIMAFFDTYGKAQRARIAADPTLKEIATLLDGEIPRGKKPWELVRISLHAAGARCEAGVYVKGAWVAHPKEAQLIPLIQKARQDRALGQHAARGLWHEATLRLHPDGTAQITADWAAEPKFRDGRDITRDEFAADCTRFPRSDAWIEPWMAKLLA